MSGASIAGPALAYWLHRYGFTVTVVERSPGIRPGGQAVDFKGATHRIVLERLGILDEVRARATGGGPDGVVVDRNGRKIATVPGEFGSTTLWCWPEPEREADIGPFVFHRSVFTDSASASAT